MCMLCLVNYSEGVIEITICCSIPNSRVCFPQLNHCYHCIPLSNVGGPAFLYEQFPAWFGLQDLTASLQRIITGIGLKNSGSGPSMQRYSIFFFDSDDLPSVLVCFIRENIRSTLAIDSDSENNNSTSNKARFHEPLWLDWKILYQTKQIQYFGLSTVTPTLLALITVTKSH